MFDFARKLRESEEAVKNIDPTQIIMNMTKEQLIELINKIF